ncbi:MAG: sulfotransferase domain-containing protein [Xanthomonadales bacterium]|jgi:hypothetical protein|nr:sulfotransferase domain-containing protein [Xanthomonadales bacterium]
MPRRSPPPGFLIIGAQKCGTTWLHRHLSRHADLWLPPRKELEFFSYTRHLEEPGLAAYRSAFAPAGDRLAGEATPSYFWTASASAWCRQPEGFQPDIPGTVRRALGDDLRLIILLRDPVERALSAWAHYVNHGELDPTLPFAEAGRYGGIVDMGFYGRHFDAWRKVFDRSSFLVLTLEADIIARPAATLERTVEFLGCSATRFSGEAPDLTTPAFPGLHRTRLEDGSVRIELNDGGELRAEGKELQALADQYRRDLERLRSSVGNPRLGAGWLPAEGGKNPDD